MSLSKPLGLTHATKVAFSVGFMVFLLVAGLAIEYIMITSTIRHSNAQWCDTLALITSRPVPKPTDPAANPSRQESYLLYSDFVTLQNKFGCKPEKS
jgi:hypothetical protein